MPSHRLDVGRLYRLIDALRLHHGLSWRALGRELDISPSTFSRMQSGGTPDADALCSMITWSRLPLDRFVVPGQRAGTQDESRTEPSPGHECTRCLNADHTACANTGECTAPGPFEKFFARERAIREARSAVRGEGDSRG